MLINIYKLVVSHAKDKCNLFIETSLAEEIHFFISHHMNFWYLPSYRILYMFSKLSLKQICQSKFEVN